ncbi:class A beta-lactamase [Jiella sp. M17.18]|uniref:class A beta-lactamase n=1 Tax=Jiella sp. M17.18 TaxID=3234247 RepID=UPI0034DEBD18
MTLRFDRRGLIASLLSATAALAVAIPAMAAEPAPGQPPAAVIAAVEKDLGARVGVAVLGDKRLPHWSHRADERFPMASTSKAFTCAALLAQVDSGKRRLAETVTVRQSDILDYAPVTKKHVGEAMTLGALCEAATGFSDNTAINLVLDAIGGPKAVTAFLRHIGDRTTRLDRKEPDLNEGTPGDPRDTTTPAAATASLRKLVLGNALSKASRRQLTD